MCEEGFIFRKQKELKEVSTHIVTESRIKRKFADIFGENEVTNGE